MSDPRREITLSLPMEAVAACQQAMRASCPRCGDSKPKMAGRDDIAEAARQ